MRKIIWSLSFTVISLGNPGLPDTQAQPLQNMFYCHSSGDIYQVWPLGTRGFIGHLVADSHNYLVLFSPERLATDTLEIGDNTYRFLQSLIVINDSTLQFNTLNHNVTCVIQNGRTWQVVRQVERQAFGQEIPLRCGHYFRLGEVELWLTCASRSNKAVTAAGLYRKGEQTGYMYNLTLPQYKPGKAYMGSSLIEAGIMPDNLRGLVYISLENAGRFVVFNKQSLKSTVYTFPAVNYTEESWRLFFDYRQDRLYAVKFRKKGAHTLYRLNKNYEPVPIKEVAHNVENITDGYMHVSATGKDKTLCHYLIPIYRDNSPVELLEDVQIQKHR